ncbi:MAG: hypothetical protein ACR2PS_12090 [Pseudomonadales bacterium]
MLRRWEPKPTVRWCVPADSENSEARNYALAEEDKTVKLSALLDAVAKSSKMMFLINAKARAEVVSYGIDLNNITYNELLLVLENNYMAAVDIDGYINIVPVESARSLAIPVITSNDVSYKDSQWVTKIIDANKLSAPHLTPILRPMVPHHAHFAAYVNSNSFIITAPYGSVKKIEGVLKGLQTSSESLKQHKQPDK